MLKINHAKVYPETVVKNKREFMCLIRTRNFFHVVHTNSFSEITKYNNTHSIVVSYCDGISKADVDRFNLMNRRFLSRFDNNLYKISYSFYMSFINYLLKYNQVSQDRIYISDSYTIKHDNTEHFHEMTFDTDIDNESTETHTINDAGESVYDSDSDY